jgi:hypothetical protein
MTEVAFKPSRWCTLPFLAHAGVGATAATYCGLRSYPDWQSNLFFSICAVLFAGLAAFSLFRGFRWARIDYAILLVREDGAIDMRFCKEWIYWAQVQEIVLYRSTVGLTLKDRPAPEPAFTLDGSPRQNCLRAGCTQASFEELVEAVKKAGTLHKIPIRPAD